MNRRMAPKVLLIGWDAADWKVATPLIDQGLMPTLEWLINNGVMGNLATLNPILSPMLWNSIATGMRPDKHGILGFMEPDPESGGIRPVSSTSRKVKAVWNILTQNGFRTHVLGWFAGHPAEPINGISVSDLYPYAVGPLGKEWPLPPGAVHPEALRDTLAELRMHPAEVQAAAILPFIPNAANINQEKDKRLVSFAKILAENLSIHNTATWILETQPWDFMAVYYNGIDHFCHGFMHFHPPRMEGVPEEMFEIYKDVVNGAYRFHDMMLARLIQLAGPNATIVLVSDHGFHSDHLRPRGIPREPAGPAVQHRQFGIFCMKGAGVKKDERIYGATLLDVTPTILNLFGLPVGEDMDGRVLVHALEEPPTVPRIPSWEKVQAECGMHPADLRTDPAASHAAMQRLVALGYVEAPNENQAKAVEGAVRESKYNLARVYLDSRRPEQALPLLEELVKDKPQEVRFLQHLAQCYYALRRNQGAKRLLEELIANPPSPLEDQAGSAEDQTAPLEAAGDQVGKTRPWADWLMGVIQFEEGNLEDALACLLRAEQADPRLPNLHVRLGNTYLRMKQLEAAERAFQKALEIDGDSPDAHLGLAIVNLRKRNNEEAATEALLAVGLQHFLPGGHYFLGVALARLGHLHRAILAFETALSMLPGLIPAHRWLAAIHSRPGGDLRKASQHRQVILRLRRSDAA